jgi:hypothetical protein
MPENIDEAPILPHLGRASRVDALPQKNNVFNARRRMAYFFFDRTGGMDGSGGRKGEGTDLPAGRAAVKTRPVSTKPCVGAADRECGRE